MQFPPKSSNFALNLRFLNQLNFALKKFAPHEVKPKVRYCRWLIYCIHLTIRERILPVNMLQTFRYESFLIRKNVFD